MTADAAAPNGRFQVFLLIFPRVDKLGVWDRKSRFRMTNVLVFCNIARAASGTLVTEAARGSCQRKLYER